MTAELSQHDKAILNCIFNPNLPLEEADVAEHKELEDGEDNTEAIRKSQGMEIEAVKLAESGKLEQAINILNEALKLTPDRASLYNNRAHVYQFQRKFEDAFNDLTSAISLAGPNLQKTLCNAYCQRGVLHRRAGRLEEAKADFEMAAKMGNQFAKSQLVELNPYAALCNQMLRQVMDTLK